MAEIVFDTNLAIEPSTAYMATVAARNIVTLESTGLVGTEEITLYKKARDLYEPLWVDGEQKKFTSTNNVIQITGPAQVFFKKLTTTNSVELRKLSIFNI